MRKKAPNMNLHRKIPISANHNGQYLAINVNPVMAAFHNN